MIHTLELTRPLSITEEELFQEFQEMLKSYDVEKMVHQYPPPFHNREECTMVGDILLVPMGDKVKAVVQLKGVKL